MFYGSVKDAFCHKTEDLTVGGKCSQCGECCSNILPMSDREARRIYKYIKRHKIEPVEHIKTNKLIYDGVCPFCDLMKEKEKCRIYKVRPNICRRFICSDAGYHRYGCADRKMVDVRATFYGTKGLTEWNLL